MPVCTCRAGGIEVGDRVAFIVGDRDADWSGLPGIQQMIFSEGNGGEGSSGGSDFKKPVKEISPDGMFFTLSPWPGLWAPCSAAVPYNKLHAPSCNLLLPPVAPDPLARFSHI